MLARSLHLSFKVFCMRGIMTPFLPNRLTSLAMMLQGLYLVNLLCFFSLIGVMAQGLLPFAWQFLYDVPLLLLFVTAMMLQPTMRRLLAQYGARRVFQGSILMGGAGNLLGMTALVVGQAWLLFAYALCMGICVAGCGFMRSVVVDCSSVRLKAASISWIIAAGILASALFPALLSHFSETLPPLVYAGALMSLVPLNLLTFCLMYFLPDYAYEQKLRVHHIQIDVVRPSAEHHRYYPACLMLAGGLIFLVMNLFAGHVVMVALGCGLSLNDGASLLKLHTLAMYVPALVLPACLRLMSRAAEGIILLGSLCFLGGTYLYGFVLGSPELLQLVSVLIGMGWSLCFAGVAFLLTQTYTHRDAAKIQARFEMNCLGGSALSVLVGMYQQAQGSVLDLSLPLWLCSLILCGFAGLFFWMRRGDVQAGGMVLPSNCG